MRAFQRLALLAYSVVTLVGCGGGSEDAFVTRSVSPLPPPEAVQVDQSFCTRAALLQGTFKESDGKCIRSSTELGLANLHSGSAGALADVTFDELFKWAEAKYPQYFWPPNQSNQQFQPYTYRYYPDTKNYLGFAGDSIYILGPISGGAIAQVGRVADYACLAAPQRCSAPGAPTLQSATGADRAASLMFLPPAAGQPVTSYTASCQAGGTVITGSSTASPLVVGGLINGVTYSCTVRAVNQSGTSVASNAVSVTPAAAVAVQRATAVTLMSDPLDFIGQGKSFSYTRKNAMIRVTESAGVLEVFVNGDEMWFGYFALPKGQRTFEAGKSYTYLKRYPFHDASQGGMDWYGMGRGCNALYGSFNVFSATYQNGSLSSIAMEFEQHCESARSALRGRIEWSAGDTTVPDGPIDPAPAGLWAPSAGQVPASGNYAFLQSDPDDYIGHGQTMTYGAASVTATHREGLVTVNVNANSEWWSGSFKAMNGLSELRRGYYPGVGRYTFHNPTKGGLEWFGMGRGCNVVAGWFVVDDIAYANGALTRLKLRFEQHCGVDAPVVAALRGQISWTR